MTIFRASKESVKALIGLQALDLSLDSVALGLAAVPVRKAAEEAVFEGKKASLAAARAALTRFRVEKKETELLVAEKEEEIRKHQRDLNQVKTNEAYKALESEIGTAARGKDELETAVLELLEKIDRAAADEKAALASMAALESALKAKLAELDGEAEALKLREAALLEDRLKALAGLPEELLERYKFLRSRLKGQVVLEAELRSDGKFSCGGCHMQLLPQEAVDLLKPDAFAVCKDCQRLLYLKKTVSPALLEDIPSAGPRD
jgi:hypothetical protein